MKFSRYLRVSVTALTVAAALVVACSDDEKSTTGTPDGGGDATADTSLPDTSTPADASTDTSKPDASFPGVTVTVTYTGTKMGGLTIAAFTGSTLPPIPPPAALATVPAPVTFPASRKLKLAPGSYIITAYLDVGGNNTSGPGPEDPRQVEAKIVTFAGADVATDLVLGDPD